MCTRAVIFRFTLQYPSLRLAMSLLLSLLPRWRLQHMRLPGDGLLGTLLVLDCPLNVVLGHLEGPSTSSITDM